MLKWVQSGLSAVAGTAEPEYGKGAIHPVTATIKENEPTYRESTVADFAWQKPPYTNVETQTFYFTDLSTGYSGFAQVIHSNVMGLHTTAQFTFRLYDEKHPEDASKSIWTSTHLEDFRTEGSNFYANNLSIEIDENNSLYVLKSAVTEDSVVELTVTRLAPGVIFGKDGSTFYGEDKENPWGSMRHVFWPRCAVTGSVKTKTSEIQINGLTMFVMALQGMKPHHAAKSWNFLNFQSKNYSAVQMEFTTPISYANTKVNIGILAEDGKIISASVNNEVVHENTEVDEVGWPAPKAITFNFNKRDDPKDVVGSVKGQLNNLVERVDVMAEIPQFVKTFISGVAGTKPYIYQYCNEFHVDIHGVTKEPEEGIAFSEATFISEFD